MKTDYKSMAWEGVGWNVLAPHREKEGGFCEGGNEILASIKNGKFLNYLKNC
jgi:hypothetical protein